MHVTVNIINGVVLIYCFGICLECLPLHQLGSSGTCPQIGECQMQLGSLGSAKGCQRPQRFPNSLVLDVAAKLRHVSTLDNFFLYVGDGHISHVRSQMDSKANTLTKSHKSTEVGRH